MGDILRRCQGEGRPYLPVRPEPSTTKSARELGGRTDGRTDAGPASPPPGLAAAAAASRAGPRGAPRAPPLGGMSYKPNLTAHMPAASLNAGECAPPVARAAPQVSPSWGPARLAPAPGGPRGRGRQAQGPGPGQRGGRRRHDSGARAAKVGGCAPRGAGPAAGAGPGPGARAAAAVPPTPAAEGSRGARRARAGEAFLGSFFLRLLGGSARAPAGGSRERPGRAGSGVPGAGPAPPVGSGGAGRSCGGRAAGAHVCKAGPAWAGLGAAVCQVQPPGRLQGGWRGTGITHGARDSMVSGGSAWRAGAGVLGTRHVGGPLWRAR